MIYLDEYWENVSACNYALCMELQLLCISMCTLMFVFAFFKAISLSSIKLINHPFFLLLFFLYPFSTFHPFYRKSQFIWISLKMFAVTHILCVRVCLWHSYVSTYFIKGDKILMRWDTKPVCYNISYISTPFIQTVIRQKIYIKK